MHPYIHLGTHVFYSFGMMVGLGTVLTCLASRAYFQRHGLDINVPELCALILVTGFAGAKLDYALLYQGGMRTILRESALSLAQGGFTYYGGMVAAVTATAIYLRIFKLPFLKTLDSLFCVSLAYGTGRIGCFLAGDGDYGVPTMLPWAVSFQHGILPTTARVHPTMLYLSAWEFTTFAVLWHLSTSHRETPLRRGTLLGLYLIASGAGRFMVEFLSRNTVVALGLKEAQLVSAVMMAVGALVLMRVLTSRYGRSIAASSSCRGPLAFAQGVWANKDE